ncbi:MAG: hypothetical protein J6R59_09865 [Paludibacteraceae bacterium]|nr:hypothetical protein [Paludibacteraceae bacterium]
MFDIYEVIFEIYDEDKLVNKQKMQAPKEMIMINFIQTVDQIGRDRRPLKVKMIRPNVIWDNFENKQKVLNNEIEFSNNAMIAWEENHRSEVKE